jgi:3-oxoacyl-[acyl-carrier protein] reductase
MDLGLADRVVAVAGSSRGIGLAIARSALAEQARVVISGRNAAGLEAAERDLAARFEPSRVHAVQCDLETDDGARAFVAAAHATFGRLDAVVLNVGSGAFRPGWDATTEEWEQALAANLWPAQRVLQHALPPLVAAKSGSVVVVASITGVESTGAPVAYSAAKAALISLAKDLSRALGGEGIRINSVAPGNVLFEGGRWEQRLSEDPEHVTAHIDAEVPLARFGAPEEIADAVLFLLSDRASFITGACLVVDGGQTRGFH